MKIFIILLCVPPLFSLPRDPQIARGVADIQANDLNLLQITADDGAEIEWNEFSIQPNETVSFFQPNENSLVINRVIEANPSSILGTLSANGKLTLINPYGIIFGKESRVDVGSLIASTFDIHNGVFTGAGGDLFCSGFVSAKGSIYFLGKKVGLFDQAALTSQSGKILIGGDFQGKNVEIPNAERVYIGPQASVCVSGKDFENGGTIILWSEEGTQFYGKAFADGGNLGGDGGFIEISSRGYLDVGGEVSTFAAKGLIGTVLFDPTGININSGANASITGATPFMPTVAGVTGNLLNTTLQTALGLSNVIVQTIGGGVGAGNIVWDNTGPVTWVAATTLTVLAHNDISCFANVTNTAAGAGANMTFVAGWDGVTMGPVFAAGSFGNANGFTGNLTIDNNAAAVTVSTRNGSLNLYGQDVSILGGTAGSLIVGSTAGTVANALSINATNDINVFGGTGAVVSTAVNVRGPITFNAGRDIFCQSGTAAPCSLNIFSSTAQNINFTAQRNISIGSIIPGVMMAAPVSIRSTGGGDINFSAPNGNISVVSPQSTLHSTLIGSSGSLTPTNTNVNFTAANQILLQSLGAAGASGAVIEVNAINSATLTVTNAAAGVINLMGSPFGGSSTTADVVVHTNTGPLTLNGRDITFQGGGVSANDARLESTSGNIFVNAVNSFSLLGGRGANGNAGIFATNGSIAINVTAGNMSMLSNVMGGGGANIETRSVFGGAFGPGTITINVAGSLAMDGGTTTPVIAFADVTIATGAGNISVTTGTTLTMLAGAGTLNPAFVHIQSAGGTIGVNAGTDVSMTGRNGYAIIQSTTGPVTVSARNLTIQGGISGAGFTALDATALIGSRDAATTVNLTGNLIMTGGSDQIAPAQIGWRTTVGEACIGPISVTVAGTALLQGGPSDGINQTNYAQIGHIGGGAAAFNTGSANAPITVNIANSSAAATALTLLGSPSATANNVSYALIGHGGVNANLTTAIGNITVTVAQGDVRMQGGRINDPAHIGHDALNSTVGSTITGVLFVDIQNGNLVVDPPATITSTTSPAGVFHCAPNVAFGSSIQVNANDITLRGGVLSSGAFIGAIGNAVGGVSLDPPVIVCANNITLGGAGGGASGIGLATIGGVPLLLAIGDVMVRADGNILLSPQLVGTNNGEHIAFIGTPNWQILGGAPTNYNSNTFVLASGSLTIQGNVNGPDLAQNNAEIYGLNDANIGIQGGVTVRGGLRTARIGTRFQAPLSTVRLWAGGDVIFQNGNLGGLGELGSTSVTTPPQGGSVDVRSAGDIRLASSIIPSAAAALIFIEGGSSFAAGALYTSDATNVTSIDGQIPTGFICPLPSSFAVGPDGPENLGTVRIDTAGYNSAGTLVTPAGALGINLTTINGDLTIHSADRFQTSDPNYGIIAGCCSNLLLAGAGTNAMVLLSTSGDIEIAGASASDSFNNITINAVPSPWTAGTILVSANNDLTVNSTVSNTTGVGSFITLRADNNDSNIICPACCPLLPACSGILTINADVATTSGPITLDSGFGPPTGISSINQIGGTVNSNGGTIVTQAVGNIDISGNALSMSSGAGNQTIESTTGTIRIDEDVLSTSGSVTGLALQGNILISSVTGTGGSIITDSGAIDLTAGNNIEINGDPTTLGSTSGSITTQAGNNTFVLQDVLTAGEILMITGNSMFLDSSLHGSVVIASSGSAVTLVVDNNFPTAPLIGTGLFSMDSSARINSFGLLQIYTARQYLNNISGLLNGLSFRRGTLFVDTFSEVWCTYYDDGGIGSPFTIYYKDCLQEIVQQAMVVVDQFLVDLHPYNEFPGWESRFLIGYDESFLQIPPTEPYLLRRRAIGSNHPKSYTQLISTPPGEGL